MCGNCDKKKKKSFLLIHVLLTLKSIITMPRASLKAKYDSGIHLAVTTLSMGLGDLILKGSCNDVTFLNGPSLTGVALGVEKPNTFAFDYDCTSNVSNNSNFKFFEIRDA